MEARLRSALVHTTDSEAAEELTPDEFAELQAAIEAYNMRKADPTHAWLFRNKDIPPNMSADAISNLRGRYYLPPAIDPKPYLNPPMTTKQETQLEVMWSDKRWPTKKQWFWNEMSNEVSNGDGDL